MRALVVTVVAVIALLVVVPVGLQWAEQVREMKALSGELEQAKAERIRLERELKNWENDDYVASQARTRLRYVKRGETQFSVADVPVPEVVEEEAKQTKGPARPWTIIVQEQLKEADQLDK